MSCGERGDIVVAPLLREMAMAAAPSLASAEAERPEGSATAPPAAMRASCSNCGVAATASMVCSVVFVTSDLPSTARCLAAATRLSRAAAIRMSRPCCCRS